MGNYCSNPEALEREKDNLQALYVASADLRFIFDQCQHYGALQALGRAVVDARHAEAYLEQQIAFYEGHEAVVAIRKGAAVLIEQDAAAE